MSTFAEIATDTAAWLAEYEDPDMPRIVGVRLAPDPYIGSAVSLQLDPYSSLHGLACWSDFLGLPVVVHSVENRILDARITTHTSKGYSLSLWNSLHAREWADLQTTTKLRFTEEPVELDTEMLRAAAGTPQETLVRGGVS